MRWLAIPLLMILAGCTLPQPVARVAPEQLPHEWQHGPPWAPTEAPWVRPPLPPLGPPGVYDPFWDPWWPGGPRAFIGIGPRFRHGHFHRGNGGRRGRR